MKERLIRMWRRLVNNHRYSRETWRDFMKTAPSLKETLIGLLPTRAWQVFGPEGDSGPWDVTPRGAADFVQSESEYYNDDAGGYYRVKIDNDELRPLWRPGASIKRNGWVIKCQLMPRYLVGLYEWGGW